MLPLMQQHISLNKLSPFTQENFILENTRQLKRCRDEHSKDTNPRDAEVRNFSHWLVAEEQDVFRLQVPVDDLPRVEVQDPATNVLRNTDLQPNGALQRTKIVALAKKSSTLESLRTAW